MARQINPSPTGTCIVLNAGGSSRILYKAGMTNRDTGLAVGAGSTKEPQNKKGRAFALPLQSKKVSRTYFLNFLLPNPARPTRPAPRRSMVAGSGTGVPAAIQQLRVVLLSGFSGSVMPWIWAAVYHGLSMPSLSTLGKLKEPASMPGKAIKYVIDAPSLKRSPDDVGKANRMSKYHHQLLRR